MLTCRIVCSTSSAATGVTFKCRALFIPTHLVTLYLLLSLLGSQLPSTSVLCIPYHHLHIRETESVL